MTEVKVRKRSNLSDCNLATIVFHFKSVNNEQFSKFFLEIVLGDDRCDNNVISTVCSQYPKVAPFTFTSSGSSVLISFVSDSSVGRHGFLIKYKSNVTETTTTAQTTEPTQTTSTVLKTISKSKENG